LLSMLSGPGCERRLGLRWSLVRRGPRCLRVLRMLRLLRVLMLLLLLLLLLWWWWWWWLLLLLLLLQGWCTWLLGLGPGVPARLRLSSSRHAWVRRILRRRGGCMCLRCRVTLVRLLGLVRHLSRLGVLLGRVLRSMLGVLRGLRVVVRLVRLRRIGRARLVLRLERMLPSIIVAIRGGA
jgi:hypothetical protein